MLSGSFLKTYFKNPEFVLLLMLVNLRHLKFVYHCVLNFGFSGIFKLNYKLLKSSGGQ